MNTSVLLRFGHQVLGLAGAIVLLPVLVVIALPSILELDQPLG